MATITEESKLTKQQYKSFGPKPISGWGQGAAIWAHVRYDDECGNGHNSFAITGTIRVPKQRDSAACGCLHDEVAAAFPELAPFIKWHLCSSDGPMHYVANTKYHASDRDYNGLLKGERRQLCNGRTKLPVWSRVVRDAKGEEVKMYGHEMRDAAEKPAEFLMVDWEPVWIEGEGKARDLDAARSCAVWPEATDEELTAPGLEARLMARLPGLLVEFRAAVESLGFVW